MGFSDQIKDQFCAKEAPTQEGRSCSERMMDAWSGEVIPCIVALLPVLCPHQALAQCTYLYLHFHHEAKHYGFFARIKNVRPLRSLLHDAGSCRLAR